MKFRGGLMILFAAMLAGCAAPKAEPPAAALEKAPLSFGEKLRPYVPATHPADPVAEVLPTAPRDARPSVPLRYTVEIWEILLPQGSVSADESFWKRVDEPAGPDDLQLQKNGVRVGELPAAEIDTVRKLIEDRGGKHSTYNGVAGRLVEIPVRSDAVDQVVFYRNRDDDLIGRSWERCDELLYLSFETTPRNPDRMRIVLTPAVRSREKKLVYALTPGKEDRELKTVIEESHYDTTVSADLALDRMLVIAPGVEARSPHTIGGTFFMNTSPAERQERFLLVIPHAYTTRDEPAAP